MTVYDLIQKLSQFNADSEIDFHIIAEYLADVRAYFYRDNENDIQDISINVKIDDNVDFDNVKEYPYNKDVRLNLIYWKARKNND